MKNFNLVLFLCLLVSYFAQAQEPISNVKYQDLLKKSPFNSLYPRNYTEASSAYFDASQAIYANGPIKEKEAHLELDSNPIGEVSKNNTSTYPYPTARLILNKDIINEEVET